MIEKYIERKAEFDSTIHYDILKRYHDSTNFNGSLPFGELSS